MRNKVKSMCISLVRDAPDWKYSQILSNFFFLENMLSNIYQIFFLGKYASKDKRSVEYGLIFSEFYCHKGGQIPLTSKLRGLAAT